MKNLASIPQNIAIEGKNAGPGVGSGASSRVMENSRPASAPSLCTVPGDADGGMKGEPTIK